LEAGLLHIDDHDSTVAILLVLVLLFLFILGTVALPVLVPGGDLQPWLFLPPALLFFAASNLFDDPGFEHDEGPLAKCLPNPTLLVKFGIWRRNVRGGA
jgi:hypothetical protein